MKPTLFVLIAPLICWQSGANLLYFCGIVMQPKNIGVEKALQKIKQYCAYQERNHREVKEKLYGYGLYRDEVAELIAQLIEENYLNEERYAIAFAGGHFRTKDWGKVKIRHALQQQQISTYCIKKALLAIEDADYQKTLQRLFSAKLSSLRSEKNRFVKMKKVQSYLLQKGFESGLIQPMLEKV